MSTPLYTPRDWYWVIGGDQANVHSSRRAASVPIADTEYVAWLATGKLPTAIPAMEELETIMRDQFPPGTLISYNADARFRKVNGGIVVNGTPFMSDPATRASLNTAYIYTQNTPGATFQWKLEDGSFVTLDKAQIQDLQAAEAKFGQDCFNKESANVVEIDAATITTLAQIDAAFATVSNVFTSVVMSDLKIQKRKPRVPVRARK